MDSKLVVLIDNCLNPFARGIVKRKIKEDGACTTKSYRVPYVCRFYNLFMGECDAASGHRKTFEIDVKSFRHNNRTFLALLEFFAFINPALLYGDISRNITQRVKNPKVPHEDLRRDLIKHWNSQCEEFRKQNGSWLHKPRAVTNEALIRSTNALLGDRPKIHQHVKYNPKKRSQQKTCRQCGNKTTYVCTTCHPQIGLCADTDANGHKDCFMRFHRSCFPGHDAYPHRGKR